MPAERTIPYQPALDGVRALAVIVVLLFHGGVSWMTGGYLGVSVFFTLSGFLITSLLIRETRRATGASTPAGSTRGAPADCCLDHVLHSSVNADDRPGLSRVELQGGGLSRSDVR